MFNVVFAANDDYSHFLSIALISLLENNKVDFDCINVFILDDNISEINKNRILALVNNYPCKITFLDLNIFDSLKIDLQPIGAKSGKSLTTYSRLFLSTLLPKDIDKVLYLDCDALILGSYKDLWEIDIDEYYCAGVLEPNVNETVKKYFWYFDMDPYINAGFLLINLDKWRKDNVQEKFIQFLSDHQGQFFLADQGVINKVFENNIKIVEPKYNLLYYFQYHDYSVAKKFFGIETEYYSKEIVDDSREHPVFVHFTGGGYKLPWHNKDHKYSSEYEKYAKMANCEDLIQYMDAPSLLAKLFYKWDNPVVCFLLKLLPKRFIIKYINKNFIEYYKEQELKMEESF